MHDRSGSERLRSLLLQVLLVGLVLLAGAMVFDTVASATAPAEDMFSTDQE